jgi:hypothetical protein
MNIPDGTLCVIFGVTLPKHQFLNGKSGTVVFSPEVSYDAGVPAYKMIPDPFSEIGSAGYIQEKHLYPIPPKEDSMKFENVQDLKEKV